MTERLGSAASIEEWADTLAWAIDSMFENREVFALLERNRAALKALAVDSDFFDEHEQWHARIEASVHRLGTTLDERVRMVCAFGAMAGFDDFGGRVMMESDPGEVRERLIGVTRQILGLPAGAIRQLTPRVRAKGPEYPDRATPG